MRPQWSRGTAGRDQLVLPEDRLVDGRVDRVVVTREKRVDVRRAVLKRVRAAQRALAKAGLTPTDVDHVNAHGGASKPGDPAEVDGGSQAPQLTGLRPAQTPRVAITGAVDTRSRNEDSPPRICDPKLLVIRAW